MVRELVVEKEVREGSEVVVGRRWWWGGGSGEEGESGGVEGYSGVERSSNGDDSKLLGSG